MNAVPGVLALHPSLPAHPHHQRASELFLPHGPPSLALHCDTPAFATEFCALHAVGAGGPYVAAVVPSRVPSKAALTTVGHGRRCVFTLHIGSLAAAEVLEIVRAALHKAGRRVPEETSTGESPRHGPAISCNPPASNCNRVSKQVTQHRRKVAASPLVEHVKMTTPRSIAVIEHVTMSTPQSTSSFGRAGLQDLPPLTLDFDSEWAEQPNNTPRRISKGNIEVA